MTARETIERLIRKVEERRDREQRKGILAPPGDYGVADTLDWLLDMLKDEAG